MIAEQLQHIITHLKEFTPEILLSGLFIVLIAVDLLFRKKAVNALPYIAISGVAVAAVFEGIQLNKYLYNSGTSLLGEMFYIDSVAVFMKIFFSLAVVLFCVFFLLNQDEMKEGRGEYFSLVIAMHIGLNLMVCAANFLMMYISLELVSICSYVLAAYALNSASSEGALKYILFGSMASCVTIYGMSLLYGVTGTLSFIDPYFISGVAFVDKVSLTIIMLMVLAAILFKLSAVPFHWWTPDVYQSAPLPVVAFFSIAPKAAALILLSRFLHPLMMVNAFLFDVEWVFFVIATAGMFVGNLLALIQKDIRRMLAYSSIAHAGFMLIAISATRDIAVNSILFYLAIYLFMNMAAFFLAGILYKMSGSYEMEKYRGIGTKQPYIGLLITILMVSLTGLPPTAGFFSKFFVLSAAWEEFQFTDNQLFVYLILIGLTNTVISLFYYLKIPYLMFFKRYESEAALTSTPISAIIFVTLLCIPILVFFMQPAWLADFLERLKLYF